jgi:hypothetical protein
MNTVKPKMNTMKKGGAAKAKPMMKKGGSMPMVKKDGKMVPAFAADGKGKMMYGGAKKSMMKKGGKVTTKKMGMGGMHMMPDGTMMKDSEMKMGGANKPKMMKGGAKKSMMKKGGATRKK